jgi:hypothetical protein
MKAIQIQVLNLSVAAFGLLTVGLTAATAQDAVNQSDTTGNAIEPPPIISNYDNNPVIEASPAFNANRNNVGLARRGSESSNFGINDIAELLATQLNQALADLAAAENAQKTASTGSRHIVRRVNDNCKDTSLEARAEVEKKLEQAKQFIEQVDRIKPGNSIW